MVKCLPARGFNPWVGRIPWRRKWQSTPVLLPGKFHGERSLRGYSPWCRKESDSTEQLHLLTIRYILFQSYILKWICSLFNSLLFASSSVMPNIVVTHKICCFLVLFWFWIVYVWFQLFDSLLHLSKSLCFKYVSCIQNTAQIFIQLCSPRLLIHWIYFYQLIFVLLSILFFASYFPLPIP